MYMYVGKFIQNTFILCIFLRFFVDFIYFPACMLAKFSHGLCALKNQMGVWCLRTDEPKGNNFSLATRKRLLKPMRSSLMSRIC